MSIAIKSRLYEIKDKEGKTLTRLVRLPKGIKVEKDISIAGGRLLLMDPRGEIDENELREFFEQEVEPRYWAWITAKRKVKAEE